jgi:hypothetical protein
MPAMILDIPKEWWLNMAKLEGDHAVGAGSLSERLRPWLHWQPMATFPQDGESYLVWNDRVLGGNPEVVFWEEESILFESGRCLATSDGPTYHVANFTHWAKVPGPSAS